MIPKIPSRLKQQLTQSTEDFFKTSGVSEVSAVSQANAVSFQWTGIIGLAGDQIQGSLAVSCTQDLLNKTHPNHALGMPVGPDDLVDWLGEIANQVLGRLKNLTLEYDLSFSLSAPNVVKGQALEIQDQGKRSVEKLYFLADGLPLLVTLIATLPAQFDYDAASKIEKKGNITEGDGFLF